MKNLFPALILFISLSIPRVVVAQDDVKSLHETARTFMMSGDYDNSILVLKRALQKEPQNLELQKDLVMAYYLKRDFKSAREGVVELIERQDADVITFQIAGNVFKALEEPKECEKMYKKAIKKFPRSGPLRSEYGELLWAMKDYSAIEQWEEGIRADPGYGGNYYNAAQFYFYTKDKVWSLIYAEIFVNMESLTERGANLKQLLLQGYKEKLFSDVDLLKGEENNKSNFAKAFLGTMQKQSSLADKGLTTEVLTMIRTRFILDWYDTYATRFPYKLFDYQRQLLQEGMFEAYNQWLFGPVENLAAYDNWTKTHPEQYNNFANFQKTRVFRMPGNQYYQVMSGK